MVTLVALFGSIFMAAAAEPAAAASSNRPAGFDWPNPWNDPTGGAANRWRDWGFNTCGPANGDYGLNDSSWYFDRTAHLGVDSSGARAGTTIKPIAGGTIAWAGEPWGRQWGGVIVVEHHASNGNRFAAVYAHLRPDTMKRSGRVTTGTTLGTIKAGQPYGDHLHFGIVPLTGSQSAAAIAKRGSTSCGYLQDGPTFGYVHPMKYLSARRPAGSNPPALKPCDYNGKVVGARGSTAKYLVRRAGGTCKRFHIPTGGDYQSIVNTIGSRRVVTLTANQLAQIPNAGQQARTRTDSYASISGPTRWLHSVGGLSGSVAHRGNFVWTTSAAGKSYVTNEAVWSVSLPSDGVYRVKCFIPNRREAWASVRYDVYDNGAFERSVNVRQRDHIGWTSLGDYNLTGNRLIIRLKDNKGAGPYNEKFALDACQAIPIR